MTEEQLKKRSEKVAEAAGRGASSIYDSEYWSAYWKAYWSTYYDCVYPDPSTPLLNASSRARPKSTRMHFGDEELTQTDAVIENREGLDDDWGWEGTWN